jgi:hypothetical protein
MNKFFGMTIMAAALSLAASSALAEQIAQPRTIDARIMKVNLGGVVNLHVKQGPVAALTIIGERDDVSKIKVTRTGDTLNINSEGRSWRFGKGQNKEIRAELTVPNFTELNSHGVGASDIQGFTGDAFNLSLDGAGSVTVNSNYRNVVAKLGGVGSMKLNSGNSDQVDLKLRGAGHIEISGTSRLLRADLGGVGSLDAQKLQADTVELDMSGLGGATVYAKSAANVKLSGMGSATIHGNPARRNADARGMGSVNWE